MRIPSGKVDQSIYFVAVNSSDLKTRLTGLTTFTVYRSRNGGTATVYTTPTVTELSAANMPGVYSLSIDEDTTIAAGSDSEEYCVHITQAAMAPVTRTIELYRRDTTTGTTIATANIDAAISSRMATYTQPTGFLAATFPAGTIANTTNITAGTMTTTTNLTNLPTIPANWLTAAGLATDAVTEITDAVKTSLGIVTGTADSGTTTTMVDAALTQADTDYWKDGVIVFTSGTISGQARLITGFTPATDTVGFSPATTQAVGTNTYIIIPKGRIDLELWQGAVVGAPATTAAIVDAIWDEATSGHVTAGTTGKALVDTLANTAEIGVAGAGLTNINLPNQTMDIVGNITGNLSGSVGSVTGAVGSVTGAVGSVTGAVGSVTGNVGGNVVGSVGSVTARVTANVDQLNGNAAAAATLAILNGSTVVYSGTVTGAATTTTLIDSGLTQADTDHFKGRILIFTSGALALQATDCSAFDPATDKLTFTATTQAPTGATYVII